MSRTRKSTPRRIRVATYNILLGGEQRRDLVRNVLRRIDADVVALQEVREVDPIRDLAKALGMEMFLGEPSDPDSPMHTAILTRLPVSAWRNRRHHGRMLRSHLHCDIETGGSELPVIGIHCVHLAARFGDRNKGEATAHPRNRRGAHRYRRRAAAAAPADRRLQRALARRRHPRDVVLPAHERSAPRRPARGGIQRHPHPAGSRRQRRATTASRIAGVEPASILASSAVSRHCRESSRR